MPRFGVPAGLGALLASLALPPTFATPCLASFATHAAASLPETGGWHGGQRQRSCPVLHGPGRTDGQAREMYPRRALPHGPAGVPAGRMLQEARTLREGKGAPRGTTLLLKGGKTSRRKRAPGRTGTPNPPPAPPPPRLTLPAGDAPPWGGRAADARSQQQQQQGGEAAAGTGTGSRHLHVLRDPPPLPGPGAGGRGRRPPCARQPSGERGWGGRGGAFTEPGREAEKEEVKEEEEEEEEAAAGSGALMGLQPPPGRAAAPDRPEPPAGSPRCRPPGPALPLRLGCPRPPPGPRHPGIGCPSPCWS